MKAADYPALKPLIARARLLAGLDAILQEALPETLRGACKVLNLRDETLIVATPTAALATQLRFATPRIIEAMRVRAPVPIRHIRCRTLAPPPRRERKTVQRRLSAQSRQLIEQTAEAQPGGRLREALRRLARQRREVEKPD